MIFRQTLSKDQPPTDISGNSLHRYSYLLSRLVVMEKSQYSLITVHKESHYNQVYHIYLRRMLRAVSELTHLHSSSFSSIQKYCTQTPARNAIYAHAQDFVVLELLLPTLRTFAQSTCSLHATRNAWMLSVCVVPQPSFLTIAVQYSR